MFAWGLHHSSWHNPPQGGSREPANQYYSRRLFKLHPPPPENEYVVSGFHMVSPFLSFPLRAFLGSPRSIALNMDVF